MLKNKIKNQKLFIPLMLLAFATTSHAQDVPTPQPKFWIGYALAANLNYYSGTTQTLSSTAEAPTAFHKGFGVAPYGGVLVEYRPHPILGFMLNVGYDNRSAAFDEVLAPCDCPATLKMNLAYLTIQPSLKITPFGSGLHVFVGGAISYNLEKSYEYKQKLQADKNGQISDTKQGIFSTHVGIGYDIPFVANKTATLSPFISYHPYFGQSPRKVESWSLSTIRIGLALKFGRPL